MYLLDQACKIEGRRSEICSYLIDEGQVRYVNGLFRKWNRHRVAMDGTVMMSGRVMLANSLLQASDFETFKKWQGELISKGCTTVAVAPLVHYERELDRSYKRAKHAMASSMLDFIIGFTFSNPSLLRPSVLRHCRKLNVSFIRVVIRSFEDISALTWTYLSQTLTNYPIVLTPVFEEVPLNMQASLEKVWQSYCSSYHIHTSSYYGDRDVWPKSLVQKVGLYPEKGALLVGSDADYILFPKEEQIVATEDCFVYHEKDPTVVIVRGLVVKAGDKISFKPGFGRCLKVRRPGRFLPIEEVM
ncbi:hypothetical protein GN156_10215 [bacterium LRH843]|nr:hypothetical protein [bacterium LRH843]